MNKIIKRIWDSWDEITSEWFRFFEWVVLWTSLFITTYYEVFINKSRNSDPFLLKVGLSIATILSSLLLIVYLFKKCYAIAEKVFPYGKSRFLWVITVIEACSFCSILASFVFAIGFTLKSIIGI